MNRPMVEFKNVSLIKGDSLILDNVSLTINSGENTAILGPNGAGKSSLIKLITRQYYPLAKDNFSFKVWGQETWDVFALRSTLGLVSNSLQEECSRNITGFEMVLSGFFSSIGIDSEPVTEPMKAKAREVIEFLEVPHLMQKNIHLMSSGEARRFLIGRALVHDPKALILDEPINNLDIHAAYKFTNLLSKLAAAGTNIIMITQNLHDIIPEISRVIFMKHGKIVNDGPKQTLLTTQHISHLFDTPIEITTQNGYYHTLRGVSS